SPAKLFDECSPDWAPSLHLGYEEKPANEGRYNRLKTRRSRSQQQVSAVASVDITAGTTVDEEPAVPDLELCHSISCQTDLTGNDIQQLQDVAANLQNELTDVKMKLFASKFSEDSLREDDQKPDTVKMEPLDFTTGTVAGNHSSFFRPLAYTKGFRILIVAMGTAVLGILTITCVQDSSRAGVRIGCQNGCLAQVILFMVSEPECN
ncbi:hypothetical protein MTO96_044570, partial [Rhipicephalus appendiculatus]